MKMVANHWCHIIPWKVYTQVMDLFNSMNLPRFLTSKWETPRTTTFKARFHSLHSYIGLLQGIAEKMVLNEDPVSRILTIRSKKGFLCDMYECYVVEVKDAHLNRDGVIYRGDQLCEGAERFVKWVQDSGKKILFLTNNSRDTPATLQKKVSNCDTPFRQLTPSCQTEALTFQKTTFILLPTPQQSLFLLRSHSIAKYTWLVDQVSIVFSTDRTNSGN